MMYILERFVIDIGEEQFVVDTTKTDSLIPLYVISWTEHRKQYISATHFKWRAKRKFETLKKKYIQMTQEETI